MAPLTTIDSCVRELVEAFANGLEVLAKKRKRKSRSRPALSAYEQEAEEEEGILRRSLRKAPLDLHEEYSRNYRVQGDRFRQGDSPALARLTTILINLNSGLVSLISSIVSGRKAPLNYKNLISLSDLSRFEALETLSQLSYRLSRSNLNQIKTDRPKPSRKKKVGQFKISTSSPSPEFILLRPNAKPKSNGRQKPRKASSKSTLKPLNNSLPPSPTISLPLPPPIPIPTNIQSQSKSRQFSHQQDYLTSNLNPSPKAQTHYHTTPAGRPIPTRPNLHEFTFVIPNTTAAATTTATTTTTTKPQRHTSVRTFATDSTKLGEIPMERWNVPFDYQAMGKLNVEAAINAKSTNQLKHLRKKPGRVGGLFKIFKKKAGPITVS